MIQVAASPGVTGRLTGERRRAKDEKRRRKMEGRRRKSLDVHKIMRSDFTRCTSYFIGFTLVVFQLFLSIIGFYLVEFKLLICHTWVKPLK